jgi:hypothetical protein
MATLLAVAARTAWTVRCVALGYIVVQVVIWHSFFAAHPERLAGPAAAVAWAAVVAARLRRSQPGARGSHSGPRRSRPGPRWPAGWRPVSDGGRGAPAGWWRSPPGWRLATLDTAVVAALALGAWWCVPPAMQGDTSSWLYIAVVSQLIVPAWFAPAAVLIPLTAASAAAFWAGAAQAGPPHPGATSPAAAAANVVATAAVARCALWLLGRRARTADAALARADAESRADYVELTLSTERREHERLLHDTVLNTLTALGRGTAPGSAGPAADLDQVAAAARCQHDVTLIEHALGAAGGAAGADGAAGGGLLIAIEAVAAEMQARGLTVHVAARTHAAEPAPSGKPAPDRERAPEHPAADGRLSTAPDQARLAAPMPDPVATALAFAVREALANVAAHAGTGAVWVALSPVFDAGRDGVEVTVRDHGAGFDPADVGPARLGLRRSIVERTADWGGTAEIRSAPGAGTIVTLRWLAPAAPARPVPGGPAC